MNPDPRRPNIALVGFMAAGKSSVGRELSSRTRMPFVDLDDLIEKTEGASISEIFLKRGESYFREIEGELFRQLCEGEGRIIGCGGGTLLDPRNQAALGLRCFAIWLRASVGEILKRIDSPDAAVRPLVKGADPKLVVPPLLQAREPFYQGADLVIDTDGRDVADIAGEIIAVLRLPYREKA